MVKNKHEYFFANPFDFHWENRFPCFCRNFFDHIKTNGFSGDDFGYKGEVIRDGCFLVWREL